MSTTSQSSTDAATGVEILTDEKTGTVTFVADFDSESIVPPTEWITVRSEDLVDVDAHA